MMVKPCSIFWARCQTSRGTEERCPGSRSFLVGLTWCQAENENVIGSKLGYCEKLPFEPQSTAQGTHLNHVWRFF